MQPRDLPRSLQNLKVGTSTVDEIDTPSLVFDLDAMDRNHERLIRFLKDKGYDGKIHLRPHAKLHKSAQLSKYQMDRGAIGMCVQKLSEAEALFYSEQRISNILITNEIVSVPKLKRVGELALAILAVQTKNDVHLNAAGFPRSELIMTVDGSLGLRLLADALRSCKRAALDGGRSGAEVTIEGFKLPVLIEVEGGQRRCGCTVEEVVALAEQLRDQCSDVLELRGIHCYHGAAQHIRGLRARSDVILGTTAVVAKAAQDALLAAGFRVPTVTGAGTGTFSMEAQSGVYTEIQPGSYLVFDRDYADNDQNDADHPVFEHALFVKAQVISRTLRPRCSSDPAYVVLDAGHKSFAIDSGMPSVALGPLKSIEVENGGDDHAIIRSSQSEVLPDVGETVWLVPGHCDPTINLHSFGVAVRGKQVEQIVRIDARGCQW